MTAVYVNELSEAYRTKTNNSYFVNTKFSNIFNSGPGVPATFKT